MLQHDAPSPPGLILALQGGAAKRQRKPGRQLLRLGEIGFRTGRKRAPCNRRDPLIGCHVVPLVDQHCEIALADQIKRFPRQIRCLIKAGIRPDPGRGAFGFRRVVIRCNDAGRAIAAHLQGQFPAQLDRLPNQRRQNGGFGNKRFNRGRIVMLAQNRVQHAIKARDATPDVGVVELKGQDGVVPCDLRTKGHANFLSRAGLAYRSHMVAAMSCGKGKCGQK